MSVGCKSGASGFIFVGRRTVSKMFKYERSHTFSSVLAILDRTVCYARPVFVPICVVIPRSIVIMSLL